MSNDFIVLTTRLAAGMSTLAAVLIGGISILALVRGTQRPVPAIAIARRARTLQLAAGVTIAAAIIIGAMPSLAFPTDADRFVRFYGVLGYPIHTLIDGLVLIIIVVGIGAVVLRRQTKPGLRG